MADLPREAANRDKRDIVPRLLLYMEFGKKPSWSHKIILSQVHDKDDI
jgi:hypothetical protein